MKVLLFGPGASWATADVEAGLRYGLLAHGVEVIDFPLDVRMRKVSASLNFLARKVKKRHPDSPKPTVADLVYLSGIEALPLALRHQVDAVVVVSGMYLHPDVADLMKRAGLRVTVLFTESPYDLAREIPMAARVDACWTNERSVVRDFEAVTSSVGYAPHGWHPERHAPGARRGDADVPAHDVVFVGTVFPERLRLLESIDWSGIDLGLYGHWKGLPSRHRLRRYVRGAGPIENTVAAALYRRSKIGLNLYRQTTMWGQTPQIARAESLNPRAYELARCGVFHLSEFRAEVPEVFGDLVPTFRTPAEAEALIRAWLADDVKRARVAAELPAAVAECSWADRAAGIIDDLNALTRKAA